MAVWEERVTKRYLEIKPQENELRAAIVALSEEVRRAAQPRAHTY